MTGLPKERELELRPAELPRKRDVLAGRLESARAERHRLEDEMHEYGAADIAELRKLVVDAELDLALVTANHEAALDRAEAVLEAASR